MEICYNFLAYSLKILEHSALPFWVVQKTQQGLGSRMTKSTKRWRTVPKAYHTLAYFFVVELQIFCRSQMELKFVGTSTCRTLPYFLSRLTAFRVGVDSISAMLEKTLVHVTLMTIPHWFRYARVPTNCLGPPHTSRQGLTRRFEI